MKKAKQALSVRDRAHFNARLSLGRVDVARRHIEAVEEYDSAAKLRDGMWVLFVKEGFFNQMKKHLSQMPFHSDEYDVVYSLVNGRKYRDMLVVTESEAHGKFTGLFQDFMVAAMQRVSDGRILCFASSGRNFLQINFVEQRATKEISHVHDCNDGVREDLGVDISEEAIRHRFEFTLNVGKLWECEMCGCQIINVYMKTKPLFARYQQVFEEGDSE